MLMQYSCTCKVANNLDLLYLTQLQLELSPLQEHFISSLHDQKTSEIVIQTGTHDCDTLVQAKSVRRIHKLCLCASRPTSCLMHCASGMQHSILGGWQFDHCSSSVTEQLLSCLIDRAQKTGFVIQDNSQTLKFLEMIVVDIQQLKCMTSQIHKCSVMSS